MTTSLFSPSWYRVEKLKPRLRSHAKIHRQRFRGKVWYVLQDQASGRYHRFSPSANLVISLMNGKRTVQEIWDLACSRLEEGVLTQDETIRLLAQLHRSDVLHGDVPPDIAEMSDRASQQKRRKQVLGVLNPLMLRIPLLDPERFLSATYPLVRPILSWAGLLLFLAVTGTGLLLAGVHWAELTNNITDRVLATETLLTLLVTYPVVKALHELGHGYVVKHWGGEVHEMGIMFLVFMPVPYIDASSSAAFGEKWQRALVGAAGILVELFLASLALFVWLNAEPGLFRAFAFNVILIGGASTLLFNGNPLLRFDGYYVLSDITEIPNLGQRSNRYLMYLAQRYLFGAVDTPSPVSAKGEVAWFTGYGIAAFAYRFFVMVAIITFVASKFFVVGVVLAVWSCLLMYGLPLAKGLRFLLTSPTLARRRGRATSVVAIVVAAIIALGFAIPLPFGTVAEGVIWTPGDSVVRARTEGIVTKILAPPNSAVQAGQPLVAMEEPFLAAEVKVLEAEVEELRLQRDATGVEDRAGAKIIGERLRHTEADLALNRQRQKDLIIRSPVSGTFILPNAQDLPRSYLQKGQSIGYVADLRAPVVRVIVTQDVIDLVRQRTERVEIRFPDHVWDVYPARVDRETPAASDQLPNLALSTVGGGKIALNPDRPETAKALQSLFQLELRMDPPVTVSAIGGRVQVRFDHGWEPVGWRLYRSLRQIFLKRFNV